MAASPPSHEVRGLKDAILGMMSSRMRPEAIVPLQDQQVEVPSAAERRNVFAEYELRLSGEWGWLIRGHCEQRVGP